MQTVRGQLLTLGAALLAVALVAPACASGTSTRLPTPASALVTVEARGGMCVDEPCGAAVVIERDGRIHQAAKPPNDLGTVPPADLATLDAAIRATDFVALRSHAFTGQCPTAYDGQELVFEFGAPNGVERIATCEIQVDFGSPLFMALGSALAPFFPFPTR